MNETPIPVNFWYGSRTEYAALSKLSNTLYFISNENILFRGEQPFAQDISKLLAFSATPPTVATVGDEYYNSSNKKIYTCTQSSTTSSPAVWNAGKTPIENIVYFDKSNPQLAVWNGSNMINISGGSSVSFASQAEVTSGTVTDKAVAPNTLKAVYYQKSETDNAIDNAIAQAIGSVNSALDNLNGEEI